jgi:formyltetrahydrofolate-dependent phosphoribosylglycinamide formyltransferase
MFNRLQQKWKVGGLRLFLIICTFAIAGSMTGFIGKKIMNGLSIGQDWLWAVVYILLITVTWPLTVLIISIPLGQFKFFTKYIKKIGERIGFVKRSGFQVPGEVSQTQYPKQETSIAIFASGAGSNTQNIIDYFRNSDLTQTLPKGEGFKNTKAVVSLIVCNNPAAGVLNIAAKENIPALIIDKEKFFRGNGYSDELKEKHIDFIVLAGFLLKIPPTLIKAYPNRIINIHPALLPKHGGKGMYGNNVHAAVIAAGEKESGITVHYIDDIYDNGDIIFQAKCTVFPDDTPDSLAQRIHKLEHEHYPKVIEEMVRNLKSRQADAMPPC